MSKGIKIAIFGLGYVGTVTGACLAKKGHFVMGVDINKDKVDAINKGKSPIIEKGLDRILLSVAKNRRFLCTTSVRDAILNTDMAMICVGTPAAESGAINTEHLESVVTEIAKILKTRSKFYTVIIRSTMLPGTTEEIIVPVLEKVSGKKIDRDFGVCVNPEFMREGNSLEDFYSPAKTVIGIRTKREERLLRRLLGFVKAPLIVTDVKTAEMCKYLDNIFHALKICFANEIDVMCKTVGVNSKEVMDIFCKDKVSNISARYLMPGFAFGGSCLPKDIKAMLYKAKIEDLQVPLMESILRSNDTHIQKAFRSILKTGKKKIAMLGLSFKPGTDDLRESQMVRLAELLIGKGFQLRIYDKNVSLSKIIGGNRNYINKEIPHISSLLCSSLDKTMKGAEVIVIGHDTKEFKKAAKRFGTNKILIDLTG